MTKARPTASSRKRKAESIPSAEVVRPRGRRRGGAQRRQRREVEQHVDAVVVEVEPRVEGSNVERQQEDVSPESDQLLTSFISHGPRIRRRGRGRGIGRTVGREEVHDEVQDVPSQVVGVEEREREVVVGETEGDVDEEVQAWIEYAEAEEDHSVDDALIGPQDRSVLQDFGNHIAVSIWKGMERPLIRIYSHSGHLRKWTLHARVLEIVRASGLYSLVNLTYPMCNKVLVSAFVERWHPETNSFHLPFGEMTITFEDVEHILGIRVVGSPIFEEMHKKESCVGLLEEYLGVSKEEAAAAGIGVSIPFKWLMDRFGNVEDGASEERVVHCARAYLLYVLGTTIFVDKSGKGVNGSYLSLLVDLRLVSDYAWGVGALAYLYRQLGLASRKNVKQIGGYMTLLEVNCLWLIELI